MCMCYQSAHFSVKAYEIAVPGTKTSGGAADQQERAGRCSDPTDKGQPHLRGASAAGSSCGGGRRFHSSARCRLVKFLSLGGIRQPQPCRCAGRSQRQGVLRYVVRRGHCWRRNGGAHHCNPNGSQRRKSAGSRKVRHASEHLRFGPLPLINPTAHS